jgi:hypothetical protein
VFLGLSGLKFGLLGSANYLVGVRRVEGFLVREWELGLLAKAGVAPWLSFELGPMVSLLKASSVAALSETDTHSTTWGVAAQADFKYEWGPWALVAKSGVRVHETQRRNLWDTSEVFRIFPLQGTLSLGIQFER